MEITIEFTFIDRKQTANEKNRRTKNVYKTIIKNKLKSKCETVVYVAKKKYKIDSPYYGCVLSRFWMFKDNRNRDYDNFCSGTKYYTDALVSQGIILKDDKNHLLIGSVWFFDNQKDERLIYKLEVFETKEQFQIYKGLKEKLYMQQIGL